MHLDVLRYFLYVVEEKSISKAAARAHISQSALSQTVQKLEEDFGYELLKRSNRGVELTDMGEIVLKYASNIIRSYEKMLEEMKDYALKTHKIVITGTFSLAAYSLPCVLYKIKKRFPNYQFELEAKPDHEIVQDVANDICHFGFVDMPVDPEFGLSSHKIGQEKIVLIAKSNYNVKNQITLEELMKMELIMCTLNQKTCDRLDYELHKIDHNIKDLNVIFNAGTVSAIKSSVINGYGMAFVPYESIKHELYEKSIKLIELKDISLDYDIYLVNKKPGHMTQPVREVMDYLLEVGRKSFC